MALMEEAKARDQFCLPVQIIFNWKKLWQKKRDQLKQGHPCNVTTVVNLVTLPFQQTKNIFVVMAANSFISFCRKTGFVIIMN